MKGTHHLIRALINGVWFIDPMTARNYAPQVLSILSGKKLDADIEEPTKECRVLSFADDDLDGDGYDEGSTEDIAGISKPNSVVVIPVHGPILKHDSWCEVGMMTRANQLQQCYANKNIAGVVFDIDTPGGESAACEIMTMAIDKRNKPVIGFVSGYMCSAGVYMFAGCDELISSSKTNMIGSIGTMCSFMDVRNWKEYEGIKFHEIYADQSKDKNKEVRDAFDGDYAAMKKNILNPLNDLFVKHVKQHRDVKETALTGKVFLTEAAKGQGLIDQEGDLNFAINQVSMFKSKFKGLEKFENKKELTTQELTEIQSILSKAGIAATVAIPAVASMLLEAEGEDGNIYVYAEEGEDPVGKRCVKADPEGNPTEENLSDGDHALKDGRTLTSSTNEEDGFSYVDSIAEKAEEKEETTEEKKDEKPAEQTANLTAEQIAAIVATTVEAKLTEFKASVSLGKSAPKAVNKGHQADEPYQPSAMERKRQEIIARTKKK